MREFRVGDLVRLNDSYIQKHTKGKNLVGRIESIESGNHFVLSILKSDCHFQNIMYETLCSMGANFVHINADDEGPYSFYDRLHSRRFSL